MATASRSPTTQQLYQGAGHHKPEERKPEESLAPINVESKVAGSIPPQDDGVFSGHFSPKSRNNDVLVHVPIQSWLRIYQCIMWQIIIDGAYCNFTSEI